MAGAKFNGTKVGILPVTAYRAPSEGIESAIVLNAIANSLSTDFVRMFMLHRRGAVFKPIIVNQALPGEDYLPSQVRGPVKLPTGGVALEPGDAIVTGIKFEAGSANPAASLQALCSGQSWLTWFTALEAAAFKGKDQVASIAVSVFEIEE